LVGKRSIGESIAENDFAFLKSREDDLADMLHPGGGIQEKLGHRFNPHTFRREQNLSDSLPQLCPAGFAGKEKRSMDLLQEGGQVADLGSFPASFDSLEGDEKAQFSPA
jgi:hypothetical protein